MAEKSEELQLAHKDFIKMQSAHSKLGFQEGFAEGHKSSLQEGFDQGFRNGARRLLKWGQLLGEINALQIHSQREGLTEIVRELHELLEEVKQQKDIVTTQDTTEPTVENTNDITCNVRTLLSSRNQDPDLVKLREKFELVLQRIIK